MDLLYTISIWLLPVLIAITFHEAAHGYVARFFGDETAARLGRVSLNPLRHIDPFGTILVNQDTVSTASAPYTTSETCLLFQMDRRVGPSYTLYSTAWGDLLSYICVVATLGFTWVIFRH